MNTTTFSPKIRAQTKRSVKNYWKGMYAAKITFPWKIHPQTEKSAKNYWKAGLDLANVKAYIKDHEAWMLILLIIFMIAGTVFYVGYQSRLDAGSGTPKTAHIENSPGTNSAAAQL
jgi:hypothetical protein